MRHDRRTALALLLVAWCGALMLPAGAAAHAGHDHELEALAALAPEAVRGACVRTIDVPGQGPSCRSDDAWLVDVPGGRDLPTHGPDTVAATELAPASLDGPAQAAVDGASVADVTCAANTRVPRYRLVYAYPPGAYEAADLTRLQLEVYRASAFLDQQAGPGRTARLRVACSGGGTPTVYPVQVDAAPTFTTISQAVVQADPDSHVLERYIVFFDGQVTGLAGQGTWVRDQRAIVDNANNAAHAVAINYAASAGVPQWHVLLHEVLHTMGAVQDGATDATGHGHCTSDADVMCYVDAAGIPLVTRCATLQADCNRDSYFDASEPTAGYLATNWNVGHWRNRWLDHGAANRDVTPPSRPGTPVTTAPLTTAMTLSWDVSVDDFGAVGYRVDRSSGSAWVGLSTSATAGRYVDNLAPGTAHTFRVVAVDAAGNESASTSVTASTLPDTTPPAAAPRPLVAGLALRSVSVEWDAATDDVAVTSYRVYRRASIGESPALATTVSAAARAATLPTTLPGESVLVTVRAVDASGNVGPPSPELSTRSLADLTRPTTPHVTSAVLTGTTLQLAWDAATDDDAVAGYVLESVIDGQRAPIAQLGSGTRRHEVANLPRPRDVDVYLMSVDLAGNRSAAVIVHVRFPADAGASTPVTPPTSIGPAPVSPVDANPAGDGARVDDSTPALRDTIAPTRPTVLRITRRTRYGVAIAWRPATDAVGVVRYRVLLLAADGRWVTHRAVPARAAAGYTIPGLRPGRRYTIALLALDAAGNASARSASISVTVPRHRAR